MVQNVSADLAVQVRAKLPLRSRAAVAEPHTAERNEAARRHLWVEGAARCDVLAEARTMHEAGKIFSFRRPATVWHPKMPSWSFAPQENVVEDELATDDKP